MKAERVVIILTGLLALVAVFMLINATFERDQKFATADAYREARTRGDLPLRAPELPSCAVDILVARDSDGVTSAAFTCTDSAVLEALSLSLQDNFDWELVVYENGRAVLSRVEE